MSDVSTSDESSTSADFTCAVLDADEAVLHIKGRAGPIVYVRPLSGRLPSYVPNVLISEYWYLYGRPAKGTFNPTPADLTVPAGRVYAVTLLATLPPLASMRPYLRAGLNPPADIDPEAVPVALEGLPWRFRATAGSLVSVRDPKRGGVPDREELIALAKQLQHDALEEGHALWLMSRRQQAGDTVERLLEALGDERRDVRDAAAHFIQPFAAQLPIEPFLAAIRDKRAINFAACLAAAYVFAAHPAEVPVDALLDLYHNLGSKYWAGTDVKIVVVAAMGKLGARATDEVIEVLAQALKEPRAIVDIRVRRQAAIALGELGERAPVEALVAGMEIFQPEVAAAAAQSLAHYPGEISEELRERARMMSDLETVRRLRYGRLCRPLDG
jgi:hypothetical protein